MHFTTNIDLGTVLTISVTVLLALYGHYRSTMKAFDRKVEGIDKRVVVLETRAGIARPQEAL